MIVLSSGTSCGSRSDQYFSFRARLGGGDFELRTWRVLSPQSVTRRLIAAKESLPAASSFDWRDVERVAITLEDVVEVYLKGSAQ